jgi:acetyltransferase
VSQSGGLLVDQMIKFARQGIGVSLAISIGNKAMIGEKDLLAYFGEDPETEVIAFYIESFGRNEGREFLSAAAGIRKPVVVLKAGKSDAGTRAVASHTGALAGDYAVFNKILSAGGLLEARDEFEFISFCEALSCFPKLPPIGGNIGIITGSGGHGSLAVDDCAAHGLSVPVFSDTRREEIRKRVSPRIREIASFRNPIDLTGSAVDDDFMATARYLGTLPEIDCILILLLPYAPGISSDLGARLSQLYRQLGKPMVAYVPQVEKYRILIEGFELNGIPLGHSVQAAVQMADAMRRRPTW